jgi:membrane protein
VTGLQPRQIVSLFRGTFTEWSNDKAPRLGAALSYYTALSIGPLMILLLRIAAAVFDEKAARGEIERQTHDLIGAKGSEAIQSIIESANQPGSGSGWATGLSLAMLLFGASGVFGQLQDSLNTIWEVAPKPGRGIRGFLQDRFLSFTMVMGIAFLLLVSLVVSSALSFVGTYFSAQSGPMHAVWFVLNFVVSTAIIGVLFALMFKLLPDVEMAWRDVWLGGFVTSLLFAFGKFGIGLYLGHSSMASSYGVAGSFVVLLVWVYYSSQILLFGAELTREYARQFGSGVRVAANAVPVTAEQQAEEGRAVLTTGR